MALPFETVLPGEYGPRGELMELISRYAAMAASVPESELVGPKGRRITRRLAPTMVGISFSCSGSSAPSSPKI